MASSLLDYILRNKEWIFSGVGVALLGWVAYLWRRKRTTSLSQRQSSGSNSTNIQAGRDATIQGNSLTDHERQANSKRRG